MYRRHEPQLQGRIPRVRRYSPSPAPRALWHRPLRSTPLAPENEEAFRSKSYIDEVGPMDDDILINEHAAYVAAKSIPDPVTRNLVLFAVAEARMRAVQKAAEDEAVWRSKLPDRPFDMRFFVDVLASMFNKRDIVRAVLDGEDLGQASGWDVDGIAGR